MESPELVPQSPTSGWVSVPPADPVAPAVGWGSCCSMADGRESGPGLEDATPNPRGNDVCRLVLPTPCRHPAPCGVPCERKLGPERHARIELGSLARLAIMAVPASRGSFREQADDLFGQVRCLVDRQGVPLVPTTLMVFLRNGNDEAQCRAAMEGHFGDGLPVTTFVDQPPCCGAALGVELWAIGGPRVAVHRRGPHMVVVDADGIRWFHCGGIRADSRTPDAYQESMSAFRDMRRHLAEAGADFHQVVRTWLYVNQITASCGGRQRYQELNRARTDFFRDIPFPQRTALNGGGRCSFPASTGIGTAGQSITMACLALSTTRPDVWVRPIENPNQTPAYAYEALYSPQSPKFSRAMAIVQGEFASFLVSGTASILNSVTMHLGDARRQTEQTIDNIERLIDPENVARAGMPGFGASGRDIAKLRVYVKRNEDYSICREVVERRWPGVPAIYLQADVCRPELLVEIEAVAFSPRR